MVEGISWDNTIIHTSILSREAEVSNPLLAEAHLPPHGDVVLCLALLHFLVVVSLLLHKRTKDVLVLVGILVSAGRREQMIKEAQSDEKSWRNREGGGSVLLHEFLRRY